MSDANPPERKPSPVPPHPQGKIGRKYVTRGHGQRIGSGRWALLASAFLIAAGGLISFLMLLGAISRAQEEMEFQTGQKLVIDPAALTVGFLIILLPHLVAASMFFCCWLWARSSPRPAMITGLIIFLILWAVLVLLDPAQWYSGILIRSIIVVLLILGIRSATAYSKLQQQNQAAPLIS